MSYMGKIVKDMDPKSNIRGCSDFTELFSALGGRRQKSLLYALELGGGGGGSYLFTCLASASHLNRRRMFSSQLLSKMHSPTMDE